jgi:hypothetical protein
MWDGTAGRSTRQIATLRDLNATDSKLRRLRPEPVPVCIPVLVFVLVLAIPWNISKPALIRHKSVYQIYYEGVTSGSSKEKKGQETAQKTILNLAYLPIPPHRRWEANAGKYPQF